MVVVVVGALGGIGGEQQIAWPQAVPLRVGVREDARLQQLVVRVVDTCIQTDRVWSAQDIGPTAASTRVTARTDCCEAVFKRLQRQMQAQGFLLRPGNCKVVQLVHNSSTSMRVRCFRTSRYLNRNCVAIWCMQSTMPVDRQRLTHWYQIACRTEQRPESPKSQTWHNEAGRKG